MQFCRVISRWRLIVSLRLCFSPVSVSELRGPDHHAGCAGWIPFDQHHGLLLLLLLLQEDALVKVSSVTDNHKET